MGMACFPFTFTFWETRSQEQKYLQLKAKYFVSFLTSVGWGPSAFLQKSFPPNKLDFKLFFFPEHIRRAQTPTYNKCTHYSPRLWIHFSIPSTSPAGTPQKPCMGFWGGCPQQITASRLPPPWAPCGAGVSAMLLPRGILGAHSDGMGMNQDSPSCHPPPYHAGLHL